MLEKDPTTEEEGVTDEMRQSMLYEVMAFMRDVRKRQAGAYTRPLLSST